MWLKTGHAIWEATARFWTKIFALNFALGVASGIVMDFQFGTNWAAYSRFVGYVFGSALAAKGIFAFFLESGFLVVLVFGWDRVSRKVHFFSTLMVFLGSVFSAVWIVIANSWQQTPAGSTIRAMLNEDGNPLVIDGIPRVRAEIVDFWALVFNPSSMDRLSHVLIGSLRRVSPISLQMQLGRLTSRSKSVEHALLARTWSMHIRSAPAGDLLNRAALNRQDMADRIYARNQARNRLVSRYKVRRGVSARPTEIYRFVPSDRSAITVPAEGDSRSGTR